MKTDRQGAVAQIARGGGGNRGEEFKPFVALEHRRLAGLDDVLGPPYGRRRDHRYDLPGHEPVEEHAHRGELLLDAWRPMVLLQVLHPCRHIERPNGREREPAIFAPGEKPAAGPRIGSARVIVVDVGGEEFGVAPVGLVAEVGDQRRHYIRVGRTLSLVICRVGRNATAPLRLSVRDAVLPKIGST